MDLIQFIFKRLLCVKGFLFEGSVRVAKQSPMWHDNQDLSRYVFIPCWVLLTKMKITRAFLYVPLNFVLHLVSQFLFSRIAFPQSKIFEYVYITKLAFSFLYRSSLDVLFDFRIFHCSTIFHLTLTEQWSQQTYIFHHFVSFNQ